MLIDFTYHDRPQSTKNFAEFMGWTTMIVFLGLLIWTSYELAHTIKKANESHTKTPNYNTGNPVNTGVSDNYNSFGNSVDNYDANSGDMF